MKKIALICVATCCAAGALAQIVHDDVVTIAPPASVYKSGVQSNKHAFLFQEQNGIQLPFITVNAIAPGLYDSASDIGSHLIYPLHTVDVWFLVSNQIGTAGSTEFDGSITFNRRILGVISTTTGLDATDFLGASATNYPSLSPYDTGRGYELSHDEWFAIGAHRRTLSFHDVVFNRMDQLRIITAATPTPEPAGFLAIVIGTAGLLLKRKS